MASDRPISNEMLYKAMRVERPALMSKISSVQTREYLRGYIRELHPGDLDETRLNSKIKSFSSNLRTRWRAAGSRSADFEKKNELWLKNEFKLSDITMITPKRIRPTSEAGTRRGRPRKLFSDASARTRRRNTKRLRDSTSSEELFEATISALNVAGRRAAADIVQQVTRFSPRRPVRLRKMIQNSKTKQIVPMAENEGLAFYMELRLTKASYIHLVQESKRRNANIFPSYTKLMEAKLKCYPEGIKIGKFGTH